MFAILITFLASFLIWGLIGLIIVFFIINSGIKRKDIIWIVISGLLALAIAVIVKRILPNAARPFILNNSSCFPVTTPTDPSFPSEHAALAFGLAFAILIKNKKIGLAFLVGACLVALGRVFANVHFIIDVIASVVLGIFCALLIDTLRIRIDN
jgi:undecaprenyl-diphosphatase